MIFIYAEGQKITVVSLDDDVRNWDKKNLTLTFDNDRGIPTRLSWAKDQRLIYFLPITKNIYLFVHLFVFEHLCHLRTSNNRFALTMTADFHLILRNSRVCKSITSFLPPVTVFKM